MIGLFLRANVDEKRGEMVLNDLFGAVNNANTVEYERIRRLISYIGSQSTRPFQPRANFSTSTISSGNLTVWPTGEVWSGRHRQWAESLRTYRERFSNLNSGELRARVSKVGALPRGETPFAPGAC